MLTSSFTFLLGIVVIFFCEVIMIIKKVNCKKNLLSVILIIYLTLLITITLFPIPYDIDVTYDYAYNFIPFASIIDGFEEGLSTALRIVGGNFVLLMPLGFILPFFQKDNKILKTFLIILATAVSIELAQHLIGLIIGYRYRNVDIDDFILNTLGGFLGYAIYSIAPKSIKNLID